MSNSTGSIPNDQHLSLNDPLKLVDQYQRHKTKLRISLTDRCNFRCLYCMPEHPVWLNKKEILTFAQLYKFCRVMVQLGITHIRLTGGEPLMRQGVVEFIQHLQQLRALGLQRISMTSNAFYLAPLAHALKQAGLDDLNISLDSLDADHFLHMTHKALQPVLAGISAALEANIALKLNCVLLKGENDQEILNLVHWAYLQQIPLRFIEYMPLDAPQHWQREKVVDEDDIIALVSQHYHVEKQQRQHDPATIYLLNQHYPLGIISTISKPFCLSCNRLRLTANGEFLSCLFSNQGGSLSDLLREPDEQALIQTILSSVWHKPAGYIAHQAAPQRKITMHNIGG
ncbi:GTP 3',8-cyclase MoaA [Acinetobacter larvae]|uniref:GTP 3',8-cyclase n=1 Tax=Acinetobacter larvae TaxID=1789224 RepID=A0A1B2M482_9GAMM|nr:GTP 3',8-cyclase MoaA [Acinetobacter larvae]AOA59951.1 cyclic pyranopterin phosphate synthase MoaA [Acinetobacter larvae]